MDDFLDEIWESLIPNLRCSFCKDSKETHLIVYHVRYKNGWYWYCPECFEKRFKVKIDRSLYPINYTILDGSLSKRIGINLKISVTPLKNDFVDLFLKVLKYD